MLWDLKCVGANMYEFPLTVDLLTEYNERMYPPQVPIADVQEWLKEINNWDYIFDMGCIWGIVFQNEEDATAFRLRWL